MNDVKFLHFDNKYTDSYIHLYITLLKYHRRPRALKEPLNCESPLLPKASLCAMGSSKSLLSALISLTGLNPWEQNPLSSWTSIWARSVEQVFMNRHADNLTVFQKIRVALCVTGFPGRLTEKTAPLSRVTVLLAVLLFCFI